MGENILRSDFRSVDEMRIAYEGKCAEIEQLRVNNVRLAVNIDELKETLGAK